MNNKSSSPSDKEEYPEEEKGLIPKLRFPEFQDTGEWVEKVLGEVSNSVTGESNREDSTSKGEYAFFDRSDEVRASSRFLFDAEAIIIAGEGQEFIPKYFVGKFDLHQRAYATLGFKKNIIGKYIFYWLYQNRKIFNRVAVGSTVPSLRLPMFKEFPIKLPLLFKEQQKIADCLSSIDDLITAHTEKHAALKAHKKGLMQQLFPAEGETVPKLRFPEFQDVVEWEEKQLSKIADLTSSKRVHLSDYVPNGVPFFRGKEITLLKNQEILKDILYISEEHYDAIREKHGVPEAGDILITAVGTLGNVYCIQSSDKFYFKDGNLIWMKNISENSRFLEVLLNVKHRDVLDSAIGSSQKALTMVELNKLRFNFPEKKEQQKIADFLSSIDELITSQTQKIESLKVHKKGLMQQLFPAVDEVT